MEQEPEHDSSYFSSHFSSLFHYIICPKGSQNISFSIGLWKFNNYIPDHMSIPPVFSSLFYDSIFYMVRKGKKAFLQKIKDKRKELLNGTLGMTYFTKS